MLFNYIDVTPHQMASPRVVVLYRVKKILKSMHCIKKVQRKGSTTKMYEANQNLVLKTFRLDFNMSHINTCSPSMNDRLIPTSCAAPITIQNTQ